MAKIHVRKPGTLRDYLRTGITGVILISAAFEQEDCMVFMDDGVYELTKGQKTDGIGMKISRLPIRLGDYEIKNIYIEKESLEERGLTP